MAPQGQPKDAKLSVKAWAPTTFLNANLFVGHGNCTGVFHVRDRSWNMMSGRSTSTMVWGQQLVSLLRLHKNQNGLHLLWQRLFWVLGREGASTENIPRTKQRGFYSSSSPHCTYRQCLISAQDLKIRMFVISRTVLFVLSPTIPITIWLFKNGLFFLSKTRKNQLQKKGDTKTNFKIE